MPVFVNYYLFNLIWKFLVFLFTFFNEYTKIYLLEPLLVIHTPKLLFIYKKSLCSL